MIHWLILAKLSFTKKLEKTRLIWAVFDGNESFLLLVLLSLLQFTLRTENLRQIIPLNV